MDRPAFGHRRVERRGTSLAVAQFRLADTRSDRVTFGSVIPLRSRRSVAAVCRAPPYKCDQFTLIYVCASEEHSAFAVPIRVREAAMNLFRLIRRQDPVPDTNVADATVVSGAPTPHPSEEIRRRQLAVLERHVVATRLQSGVALNGSINSVDRHSLREE